DLYALGCIFCELLTGAPPAPGAGAPPALAGVPADLRAIATKLIAPDPDDRYQSCSALAAALAAHGPSPAAGASAPARAARSRNGHGPAKAWAIAFFTGWMMRAASANLGVGESYGASVNWGFTFFVVVPLVFAFLVR